MSYLRWLRKYGIFIALKLLAAFWFWTVHTRRLMHQRARFTVGEITGDIYQPKSGKYYHYRFQVQGQTYEGSSLAEAHMNDQRGARFVVEYDSTHPGQNLGHFTRTVPDSV